MYWVASAKLPKTVTLALLPSAENSIVFTDSSTAPLALLIVKLSLVTSLDASFEKVTLTAFEATCFTSEIASTSTGGSGFSASFTKAVIFDFSAFCRCLVTMRLLFSRIIS